MKYKFLKLYLRPTYHTLKVFPYLLSENGLVSSLWFLIQTIFQVNRLVTMKIAGLPIRVRTASTDISVAVSCLLQHEFATASHVKSPKHHFIVDAGGYIGTAAIALAQMFPQSTVVSLEPSDQNFPILSENVKSFKNIFPLKMALMSQDQKAALFDAGSGEWGFTVVKDLSSRPESPMHEIDGISIESLLKKFNNTGIDVMKLDIEGGERDLLIHSHGWINNVGFFIVELHDYILPGCKEAFTGATSSMKHLPTEGEKVVAYQQNFFSP